MNARCQRLSCHSSPPTLLSSLSVRFSLRKTGQFCCPVSCGNIIKKKGKRASQFRRNNWSCQLMFWLCLSSCSCCCWCSCFVFCIMCASMKHLIWHDSLSNFLVCVCVRECVQISLPKLTASVERFMRHGHATQPVLPTFENSCQASIAVVVVVSLAQNKRKQGYSIHKFNFNGVMTFV